VVIDFNNYKVWFVTGSQDLYGKEILNSVEKDSKTIVKYFSDSKLPVEIIFKPVMTNPESIKKLCLEANQNQYCIGLIFWMHTFSPAKMWISGLKYLQKPFTHLHTQFNRDIPWSKIDMDFMNLNQSAHGDREFGFIVARMGLNRKVIVGHWQDQEVIKKLDTWIRAAAAWHDAQGARIARLGDNMREVAVTEGDKVDSQIKLGYSVNGYGVGVLAEHIKEVKESSVEGLIKEYKEKYLFANELLDNDRKRKSLYEAARIEIGLRSFLEEGNFKGFTTNFEDLYGLPQLPGIAVQRLMNDGFGFGAEGDWKTAALVRAMKVMAFGLNGGTSFMEAYTYHLEPGNMKVMGAHMLEICESIASEHPVLEIKPLSIGGKNDPVRLVFNSSVGNGINCSIIDMGNRLRMIVNKIEVVETDEKLPKLPVARAIWKPIPDLKTAVAAWILAGGAHHTGFSLAVNAEHMEDFAEIANIEFLLIDKGVNIKNFKKELRWNEAYYKL
jgi:L-arabinose isomerase